MALITILLYGSLFSVQANNFKFNIMAQKTELKAGDTVKIDMSISEIEVKEGINVVEANLEYDENVFESVTCNDANEWKTTFHAKAGEGKGKFVIVKLVEGVTKEETIGQIQLKLKDNVDEVETEIRINEITSNDGQTLIREGNRVVKIKITKEVSKEPQEQDKNLGGNKGQNVQQKEEQNQIQNPTQLVYTQTEEGNTKIEPKVEPKEETKGQFMITDNLKTGDAILVIVAIAVLLISINLIYFILKRKQLKQEGKEKYRKRILISIIACIVLMVMVVLLAKDVVAFTEKEVEEIVETLKYQNEDNPESSEYLVTDSYISRIKPGTTIEDWELKLEKTIVVKNLDFEKQEKINDKSELVKTGMTAKYEENGNVYGISVVGDVNGDGICNQIDLTRDIREYVKSSDWRIEKLLEKLSADVTCDGNIDEKDINSIVEYLVYGKLEIKAVEPIKAPTIEMVSGKEVTNGRNISSVTVKIRQEQEEAKTEKTMYKITGTKTIEEQEVGKEKEIQLTEGGIYRITSYTYGNDGNKSKGTYAIIVVEEPPEIKVNNANTWTNENIKVTIEGKDGYDIEYRIDDGEWKKYEGEFEVERNCNLTTRLTDGDTKGIHTEKQIVNIDKEKPTGGLQVVGKGTSKIALMVEGQEAKLSGLKEMRVYAKEKTATEYECKATYTYQEDEQKNHKKQESLVIETLKADTEYDMYVELEDFAGNVLDKETAITEVTEETAVPIIMATPMAWFNGNIGVTIEEEGYRAQYKINDGEWIDYTQKFEVQDNCKITARLIEQENPENISKQVEKQITNIDKIKPIGSIEKIATRFNQVKVKVQGQDEQLSGIYTMKIYVKEDTANEYKCVKTYEYGTNDEDYDLKEEIYEISDLKADTTYKIYVEVKDKAGNMYLSSDTGDELTIQTLKEPDLMTIDAEPTTYTKENVMATITMPEGYQQEGYEVEYMVSQGNVTQETQGWTKYNSQNKITIDKNTTIYARLAKGDIKESIVTKKITNIDKLVPMEFTPTATSTTNCITVSASTTDAVATKDYASSGMAGYRFSIDNGSHWTSYQERGVYTFDELEQGNTYTILVEAKDNAGGTITESVSIGTSLVPGLVAGQQNSNTTFIYSPNQNTLTNGNVMVQIQTDATVQGYTLQYKTEKTGQVGEIADWTAYTGTITLTRNQNVYARLWDGKNYGTEAIGTVGNIDKLPPVQFIPTATSTTNSVTVSANTTDSVATSDSTSSGIAGYRFSMDNGNTWTAYQESGIYTFDDLRQDITYTIMVEAKDNVGNTVTGTVRKMTGSVPVLSNGNTTFDYQPNGYTNGAVVVTITATIENGYSLQYYTSKVGQMGETGVWTTIANPGKVTLTRNQTIYARVIDSTGQSATTYATGMVEKIDKLPPVAFTPTATSTTSSITVTASTTDAVATDDYASSGIEGYRFSKDNGNNWTEYQEGGTYIFESLQQGVTYPVLVEVKDYAGETTRGMVSIATSLVPALTAGQENSNTTFRYEPNQDSLTNQDVTVEIQVDSTLSDYTLQYRTAKTGESGETNDWTAYTGAITLTRNQDIYARLWDGTNYGGEAIGTVGNIDKLPPTEFVPSVTSTTNSITVTASATDALPNSDNVSSGLEGYRFSKDNGNNWTEYQEDGTYTFSNLQHDTSYTIKVEAKDKVGNTTIETVNITTNLVPTLTVGEDDSNTIFRYQPSQDTLTNGDVTVEIETDSTVKSNYTLQYRTSKTGKRGETSNWTEYTGAITLTRNQVIYARLWDGINAGGQVTGTVGNIDKLAPADFVPTITNTTNTITIRANTNDVTEVSSEGEISDNVCSGVDGYRFRMNDGDWTEYQENGTYEFNHLTQNTTYTIEIEVKDRVGNTRVKTLSRKTDLVPELTNDNTTFTYDPNGYTNGNVEVTITHTVGNNYYLQYHTEKTGKSGEVADWTEYKGAITLTRNQAIYARVVDSTGQGAGGYATGSVEKIDKLQPTINTISSSSTTHTIEVMLVANDTNDSTGDNASSGIVGYRFSKNSGTNWTAYQESGNYTFTDLAQGITYDIEVEVKDGAGNTKTGTVSVKTDLVPGLTDSNTTFAYSPSGYTNGNVEVTITTTAGRGYTLQYATADPANENNWNDFTTAIPMSQNAPIYARV